MRSTQPLSITVPHEMAAMIKEKVASGQYASESEVVREGLRALQERDAAVERWLREEVAPTYDAVQADPTRLLPADETWRRLQSHMNKSGDA